MIQAAWRHIGQNAGLRIYALSNRAGVIPVMVYIVYIYEYFSPRKSTDSMPILWKRNSTRPIVEAGLLLSDIGFFMK
jgi:hypothetical protein